MGITIEEQMVRQFQQIRTIPPVLGQLGLMLDQPDATLRDAEELLSQDQHLCARLLQILNSPVSFMPSRVESLAQAFRLLGMRNLHMILITETARSFIYNIPPSSVLSPESFWRHSAASGLCCKMIAEQIFTMNGYQAYLCGLLHAIGLIAIAEAKSADLAPFAEISSANMTELLQAEQKILEIDHCQVGYHLALHWGVCSELAEVIRDYRMEQTAIVPDSLIGILLISEYITQKLDLLIFKSTPFQPLNPSLVTYMQENLEEYRVLAEELLDELNQMLSMYAT